MGKTDLQNDLAKGSARGRMQLVCGLIIFFDFSNWRSLKDHTLKCHLHKTKTEVYN